MGRLGDCHRQQFGAGLPQLVDLAGDAKSYVDRLFDFPAVSALPLDAAAQAIQEPIEQEGAQIDASQAREQEAEG